MTAVPETDTPMPGDLREIQVTVDYLPAAAPFHHRYALETIVEAVHVAAMKLFSAILSRASMLSRMAVVQSASRL